MHFLDLIMYFVCVFLLWKTLAIISDRQLTEEIGSLVGVMIVVIFTIAYIIAFAFWPDWNWIDFDWSVPRNWFKW